MDQSVENSALEPMVERLNYHVKFGAGDRAAVCALSHKIKMLERHDMIVREHDRPTQSCLMLSGYSVRFKLTGTGSRQILAIHMKGDMVDLQNSLLGKADHSVQMLTAGRVAFIPREEIVRLAADRVNVGRAMWIDTLVEASIAREWITNVGRRDARARVAHLLCEFALRLRVAGLGQDTHYELPMTQEQLGDATGLTPVHVNRTIKALEAEGLIERANPRFIDIGDWRKLAKAGDFDSNYLHLREDEPALV